MHSAKRPPAKRLAAARLAHARTLFDEGVTPLNKIAALLKRSPASFLKLRADEGWPNWPGHELKRAKGKPGVPASSKVQRGANLAAEGDDESPGSDENITTDHAPTDQEVCEQDDLPLDTRALSRRVEQDVQRELRAVEKRLGSPRTTTAEANARILASLVKSLAELRRLNGWVPAKTAQSGTGALHENEDNERPPRSIAELREELAAKLDRLRADHAAD